MHHSTNEWKTITFTVTENVATLILNRPARKNALDNVMRQELADAVSLVRRDRQIKVLVLGGTDGAFCAGGDISTMSSENSAEQARDRMLSLQCVISDLLTLDRPIIAAVDGPAYGAGFGIALTADMILASPRARFCLSFLKLGAVPDCGVFYSLPRIVGLQVAKQLAFSTKEFRAEQAKAMGIVLEIQPEHLVLARAQEIAMNLSKLPLASLSITKRAFNASLNSDLITMLEMEATGQGVARSTAFHQEATQQFVDKKPPLYDWIESDTEL